MEPHYIDQAKYSGHLHEVSAQRSLAVNMQDGTGRSASTAQFEHRKYGEINSFPEHQAAYQYETRSGRRALGLLTHARGGASAIRNIIKSSSSQVRFWY